ncbi:MAG: UDP-glucose 4-epimerase GalE [Caulobacteraceae bacterium]
MSDKPAILVTGGAGYIGSHACEALARAGYTPVTYDNLSRGFRRLVRFGPLEEGDIRDQVRLAEVLAKWRPAAAMHFAALIAVGESVQDPALYYDNNVRGALTLLEALGEAGVDKVVFSSTAAVYGLPEVQPVAETAEKAPINPYGRTKWMIERVLADYGPAYGLRSVSLRYFNACGAHPTAGIGEMHEPETHLIPRCLMAVQGAIGALDLMGTDYPTPDGTAVRDYVHVCDLADAHLAALRYLEAGGATTALNLGVGRGYSNREIIDAVGRVTGRPVPIREAPRRPGDPPVLTADPSLAREVLGFSPRWTDIDAVIETAWTWARVMAEG